MLKHEHNMQYQQVYQQPSFYLNILVKKGHNSKTIAFRAMSLVLQLHHVMMSKYSKFGVDIFTTFWVMCYIKVFANVEDNVDDMDDLAITIAQLFLRNLTRRRYKLLFVL